MRKFFSILAKILYKKKYDLLHKQLVMEYSKIDNTDELSNNILTKILISGEDHRFKYHFGFDIYAIVRASKNRLFLNKTEGASTIEQQLVRVLINEYDKNLKRKVQEILLSTTLVDSVPRKRLPAIYLSIAYYGTELQGLKLIMKKFNINNYNDISIETATEIVSRIKYPEPKKITNRRKLQIERRKQHLIYLHEKHTKRKILKIYE
jgi:membrane peptidoglycan carboxypeptidase